MHYRLQPEIGEEINDDNTRDAMKKLIDKGYQTILKDGNTISFLIWAGGRGMGAGIAYSIDGVHEPQISYLTNLEPLSKEKWYYYSMG